MSVGHGHQHQHKTNAKSGPARMATTQEEFRKEISRRFRNLRGAVRVTIVENDALRLNTPDGPRHPRDLVNVEPAETFDFPTDDQAEKIEAFDRWFERASGEAILEPLSREDIRQGRHYTSPHMRTSYENGIEWADSQMSKAGFDVGGNDIDVVTQLPQHKEALRTVYLRSYSQLEGITTGMQSDLSRILSDEMRRGAGSREIAREITGEMRSIENTRAKVLARTEVMNAHAQATGQRYKQFGVELVDILTFDPCDRCAGWAADNPHPVDEVQGAMPFHPNCVCAMTVHRNNT